MQYENEYLVILEEELISAMGCTEPIAIALAAAFARQTLGNFPTSMNVGCSGNIIKNVQSVIIPNTGQLRGVQAAAIAGALYGDPALGLKVLEAVPPEKVCDIRHYVETGICKVYQLETDTTLAIHVDAWFNDNHVVVQIMDEHSNICRIEKNGEILYSQERKAKNGANSETKYACLSVKKIIEFVNKVELSKIKSILEKQVDCNMRIAEEGLQNKFGLEVGKTLLSYSKDDLCRRACAYAAAGSDARMSGCTFPVVINSGSGNQGLCVSLPVIVYAQALRVGEEKLYRALALSNLIAIHVKTAIGRLSAFCGAVSAASGAGAAITYLNDNNIDAISRTIVNTLGTISGMVCDGAKPSCAAKIAVALETAFLSHKLSMAGRAFSTGEGIIKNDVENTIKSVAQMASLGMKQTDAEILKIMLED